MNIDYKLIGSRISKIRKSRGFTQENLAEKLDVSIGYISQVERGITKISLDLLGKIAGILSSDVTVFLTDSAINESNYLNNEYIKEFSNLSSKNKKLVIAFINMLNTGNY